MAEMMRARQRTVHVGTVGQRARERAERDELADKHVPVPIGVLEPPAGEKQRLFITFFESREAAAAAEARFEAMGDEVSEDIRGRRTSVEVYDVLFEGQP